MHLCADEIGILMAVITAVGTVIKPIRHGVMCLCSICWSRIKGK